MINRKGSVIDIIVFIVIAFSTLLVLGMFVYLFNTLETELGGIGTIGAINMTSITADTFGIVNNTLSVSMHTIAVIIIVFSALSIFIHNFLVKAHPVFFMTYVVMAFISIIAAAYVSNEYMSLLSNEVLGETLQGFSAANYIMAYLPYWVAVIGVFGAIFLFIGIIRDRDGGGIGI